MTRKRSSAVAVLTIAAMSGWSCGGGTSPIAQKSPPAKAPHLITQDHQLTEPVSKLAGVEVGVFLAMLMDQLQSAIEAARNAGLALEIQAGREVAIAIENARNAYIDILNVTMDRVDQSVTKTLDQVQSLVNSVVSSATPPLDQISAQAQQIVNSLPFREHEPQLMASAPRFIVPSAQDYPVTLHFSGNFEFASRSGFTPTLQVDGHPHAPSGNTTRELTFLVSASELAPITAANQPRAFVVTPVTLIVPWQSGFIVHTRHEDQYRVLIGALPYSPGALTLSHVVSGEVPEYKRFAVGGFHLASTRESGNDDHINVPYSVTPETGWNVVRNTSKLEVASAQGDWSQSFGSDDGNKVVYYVTTIHHRVGSSGSVDFAISFQETRSRATSQNVTETLQMKWGESHTIPYPTGSWTLFYDSYVDGTHKEFKGADIQQSPFLKIVNQGGSDIIQTADPRTLVWPN